MLLILAGLIVCFIRIINSLRLVYLPYIVKQNCLALFMKSVKKIDCPINLIIKNILMFFIKQSCAFVK